MPYLYASAVINVHPRRVPLGPTALALLADTVTRHLAQRERFTVYLDWRGWWRGYLRQASARYAEVAAHTITQAVRARAPGRDISIEQLGHNRFSLVLRFVPADEWHPRPAGAGGQPVTVYCDASEASGHVRGGIAASDHTVTVDLDATGINRNSDAEFLTVCLALLTAAGQNSPLTVYADETEAVRAGRLLYDGQIPPWVYRHGTDLTQRIVVAAMTASRLRPVHIEHTTRNRVHQAHVAADATVANEYMLSPNTWATRQGINLSWEDRQRGLDRYVPARPPFQSRA